MIPFISSENAFLGNCLTFSLTFLPKSTLDDVLDCSGLLKFLSQMFNSEYFLSWERKGESNTCQQWWELSVSRNTHFLFLHGILAEIFEILSPVVSLIYFNKLQLWSSKGKVILETPKCAKIWNLFRIYYYSLCSQSWASSAYM